MGEAWFSVLALEYYVHLSEWTWTEATWRNYWIRGLQMCCGRQDQTSIPDWWWSSAPPSSALPFLLRSPILGHFCYYQKAGNWKFLPWMYYFYLKVAVFVLAYGDQYLFDLTSAIQWVQLIQCIINDIIFFCDGILPSVLSQENGTWFPFNQDSRLWPCPVSKPNAKPTYFSWVNTLYWSKNHHGSEAWHSNLRQEHQAELVSYAKSAPPPGQVGMAGDRGMCNLRKTDIC